MRTLFSEYYTLSNEEYERVWKDSLIVFDTNVLLDLYRRSEDACVEILDIMKSYEARLWLPYQVAWEFQRNRIVLVCSQRKAYNQLCDKVEDEITKAISNIKNAEKALYKRHPYISLEKIERSLIKSKDAIKKNLELSKSKHPIHLDKDFIFDSITHLYNGRIGENYDEKRYQDLFSDAKKRYENKVPPGYADESNKKDKSKHELYGDYILWLQVIEKSKIDKRDIILVSNDEKEDWRDVCHGENISPRKELIREFENETGQKILIYNSQRFLEYAKQNNAKVSTKTMKEITAETNRRNARAHYGDVFKGIDFEAINEFAKRLGQYSASIRRVQEQISSSIAVPTLNVEVPNVFQNSDEIVADFERQRKELAQIISPNNNGIEDRN